MRELQLAAQRRGFAARCHFVPWTSRIGEYYSSMDVLVAPSVAPETFCRVVAEAQARQIAVIGTRAGGISEAFSPDLSGLLVEADDSRALRRAIDRLRRDRDLRKRFGEHGRRFALRHFAPEKIAEDFLAALADSKAVPRAAALDDAKSITYVT